MDNHTLTVYPPATAGGEAVTVCTCGVYGECVFATNRKVLNG